MRSPLIRAEHDGNIREYATDCLDAGPRAADDLYIYTADGEVRCRYGFNNGGFWTYDTQVLYRIVQTSHQTGGPNADGYQGDTYVGGGATAQAHGGASPVTCADWDTHLNMTPDQRYSPGSTHPCGYDTSSSDWNTTGTCDFDGWNTSHVVDGMQMPICSNYRTQNKYGPNSDGTW